ncbi:ArsC family protein, partial [Rhizobium sp. PP-WC-2G-219]
ADLGLDNPDLSDDQLLDAMLQVPILINRPFVVTPLGTRLSRPSEVVLDILPETHKGAFTKEDGETSVRSRRATNPLGFNNVDQYKTRHQT